MEIFKGENLIDFIDRFDSDNACKEYLSELKWADGYQCTKCGHEKYTEKYGYLRVCTKCKHIESPTANTLFHKVKFGLRKAFMIAFEMSATTKGLSSSQVAKRYGVSRKTAWLFMHKLRVAMRSSGDYLMTGKVQLDKFVIGGKENMKQGRSNNSKKKKVVVAVELTEDDKVKRTYSMCIEDYSSKSLRKIFEKYISTDAEITTDKWTGYKPLFKDYNLTQIPGSGGQNFKQLHQIIHQINSWIRTTYSWTHKLHTNKYLDEYSFRINRAIYKDTIFHKLIERMVLSDTVEYKDIIVVAK